MTRVPSPACLLFRTPKVLTCVCPAVAQGMGLWSSPVEGQLPSSLETTPSDVLPAAAAAAGGGGGSHIGSRHTSKCAQAAGHNTPGLQSSNRQQQQQPAVFSRHSPVTFDAGTQAAAGAEGEATPPPTVVLPDVLAAPSNTAGAVHEPAVAGTTAPYRASHSSSSSVEARQQRAPAQPAAAREPLR